MQRNPSTPRHARAAARLPVLLPPVLTSLLASLLIGCGGGGEAASPPDSLDPEEFIEIMVELREAEREVGTGDSAAVWFARRRSEILARHSATETDLRQFVAVHHGDFDVMSRVWETINQRLKQPRPRHADPDSIRDGGTDAALPADSPAGESPSPGASGAGTDVAPVKGPRR